MIFVVLKAPHGQYLNASWLTHRTVFWDKEKKCRNAQCKLCINCIYYYSNWNAVLSSEYVAFHADHNNGAMEGGGTNIKYGPFERYMHNTTKYSDMEVCSEDLGVWQTLEILRLQKYR